MADDKEKPKRSETTHQCYQVWSAKQSKWIGAEHRPDCCYATEENS